MMITESKIESALRQMILRQNALRKVEQMQIDKKAQDLAREEIAFLQMVMETLSQ